MANAIYQYQPETIRALNKISVGTVAHESQTRGMKNSEPLIVILDSLLRYAKAYQKRYYVLLCEDSALGKPWLNTAKSVKLLLDGCGAFAMEKDLATDSIDSGACQDIFWAAMDSAGFKEEDL